MDLTTWVQTPVRLFAFHIMLILLVGVWMQLFFLQPWVNCRADWSFEPWYSNQSKRWIQTSCIPEERWTPPGYSCLRHAIWVIPQQPNQFMGQMKKIRSLILLTMENLGKISTMILFESYCSKDNPEQHKIWRLRCQCFLRYILVSDSKHAISFFFHQLSFLRYDMPLTLRHTNDLVQGLMSKNYYYCLFNQ